MIYLLLLLLFLKNNTCITRKKLGLIIIEFIFIFIYKLYVSISISISPYLFFIKFYMYIFTSEVILNGIHVPSIYLLLLFTVISYFPLFVFISFSTYNYKRYYIFFTLVILIRIHVPSGGRGSGFFRSAGGSGDAPFDLITYIHIHFIYINTEKSKYINTGKTNEYS